ncbi:MAG: hypothetical protein COX57_07490 [Alphaproteobacteria bacterium CG_4_10_14_0_2_um_filter_63_37]|nr:MAG: hypothetical protein AUJ55_00780 [Proteobacteria bacterium CG1_02_64_396]PJA24599.1 MAG: hypothetical protein COX57_07490 [Alphaproteobacteria bacterium CG_4_10_14_0_2_um_filter_63_37]
MSLAPWEGSVRLVRRRQAVVGGFLVVFALLVLRAIEIQVVRGPELAQKVARQTVRDIEVPGERGRIFDRNGRLLAMSISVPSLYAFPDAVIDPAGTAATVGKILGIAPRKLAKRLAQGGNFVWLARQINPKQQAAIERLNLPGLKFIEEPKRFYPMGVGFGQILGFVGIDGKGLEGIEYQFDALLQGRPGKYRIRRDNKGRPLDEIEVIEPSLPGQDLVLNLDARVQQIALDALVRGVRRWKAKGGTAVAVEVETGKVVAMVSLPLFNPNNFADSRPSDWRNRAVMDAVEPGSTFKIVTLAAAIERGGVTPKDLWFAEQGRYRVADRFIHDVHGEGWLTTTQVLVSSSNIGAVKIQQKMGVEPFLQTVLDFGFGSKTGIDLPAESSGSVFTAPTPVQAATMAFGQGISVTALQMAMTAAAIGDGGLLNTPRVVAGGGTPRPRRVLEEGTAQTLKSMMEQVVMEGTGKNAILPGYRVAGKTGTAQKVDATGGYSYEHWLSAFVGLIPVKKPQYAIVVHIDEPTGRAFGGTVAAPVFREIAARTIQVLGIPPDDPAAQEPLLPLSEPEVAQVDLSGGMPDLTGLDLRSVLELLDGSGIEIDPKGVGLVVAQSPKAGQPFPAPGGSIALTLASASITTSGGEPQQRKQP